jgi:hypothetical protein
LSRDCKSNITKARRKPRIDGRICNSVVDVVLVQEALIPSRHGPISKLDFSIVALRRGGRESFPDFASFVAWQNVTTEWGKARKDKL